MGLSTLSDSLMFGTFKLWNINKASLFRERHCSKVKLMAISVLQALAQNVIDGGKNSGFYFCINDN
jgi:hypothetical protein